MPGWRTRRYKGCFHRRGKARYDLVFDVATRVLAGGGTLRDLDAETGAGRFGPMLTAAGDELLPGRSPRHLAVGTAGGAPLAVLRGDGLAATPSGPLALDDLWWAGSTVDDLAAAVLAAGRVRRAETSIRADR